MNLRGRNGVLTLREARASFCDCNFLEWLYIEAFELSAERLGLVSRLVCKDTSDNDIPPKISSITGRVHARLYTRIYEG